MKNHTPLRLIGLISSLSIPLIAHAALSISAGDISADAYTYTLSFGDTSDATKFNNDVYDVSLFAPNSAKIPSMTIVQAGTGTGERHFASPTPSVNDTNFKTASFTYLFDFSTTGYAATSMTITDSIHLFTSGTGTAGTAAIEYSFDNTNWVTIRGGTGTTSSNLSSSGTQTFNFSGDESTVYYRVSFVATSGSFGFSSNAAQWGRTAPGGNVLNATFSLTPTVVPEPTSSVAIAAGAIFARCSMMRRRRM